MTKFKNNENKINSIIEKMGISIDKQKKMFRLLMGEKLYTVSREGYGRSTKFIDQTNQYTRFLDNFGIKYNIYIDAPHKAKCGTYIIINDSSSIKKKF